MLATLQFYYDCLDMFDYTDHQSRQQKALQPPRHLIPCIQSLNLFVEGVFEVGA